MKKIIDLVKKVLNIYKEKDIAGNAAILSYYLILSFFPFALFLLSIMERINFGEAVSMEYLSSFIPSDVLAFFDSFIKNTNIPSTNTVISLGGLGTLWAASNGISALIKGINKIFFIKESRNFIILKIASLLIMFGIVIIIIFCFVFLVFGEPIGSMIFEFFGISDLYNTTWNVLRYLICLAFIAVGFTFIYFLALPRGYYTIGQSFPGALFTTVGWVITSTAFGFYINNFSKYTVMYGSIGAIIIVLMWLYLSSNIILIGAMVNNFLHARKQG